MTIWQTNNWKKLILTSNQASDVFEIDWIFIEKRSLWLKQFWLFALWVNDLQKVNEKKIIELCIKEKCIFIQLETFELENNINLKLEKFKIWYHKKFITPYTAIIKLEKPIEEILSEMKPKWRYNINLAEKKWVTAFEAEKNEKNIKIFYELMLETTSRDNFSWNTLDYYKKFLEIIPESKLIFTKLEDKVLSAWIFVFDKEISIYYYWASTSDKNYRNLMAPYLMQFFAIKKAKEIWSKYYDFLWVATPNDEKSSLAWVTDFKLKFTRDVINCSISYIFINKQFNYIILKALKYINKFFK